MKSTNWLLILVLVFLTTTTTRAQQADSTGLPGDNFDLQGALEMFKKASSPEEFEKLINSQDNNVNNLDLNGDGEIDYVRVIDKAQKELHAFILQVPISETESQDIAVIELEKTGNQTAVVQIIGDEDIYGEETIAEPADEGDQAFFSDDTHAALAKGGPNPGYDHAGTRVIVNVWFWPSVRFIYAPGYTVGYSPWKWRHYPVWWRPWRPLVWHAYHPLRLHYHRPFVVVHTHRVIAVHRIYKPVRVTSVSVRTRNQVAVNNYRVTRSRTTVTGHRGNSVTRKTTTVKGPRGNKAKVNRTTIKRRK